MTQGTEDVAHRNGVELTLAFLACVEDETPERLRDLVTDDFKWWNPKSSERLLGVPYPVRGVKGTMEMVRRMVNGGPYRVDPDRRVEVIFSIAQAPYACVFVKNKTKRADGSAYEHEYVYLSRVENGKLAELWEVVDTNEVFHKLGILEVVPVGVRTDVSPT